MVTGYWPYSASTKAILDQKIENGDIKILENGFDNNELLELVENMLKKKPVERWDIDTILSSSILQTKEIIDYNIITNEDDEIPFFHKDKTNVSLTISTCNPKRGIKIEETCEFGSNSQPILSDVNDIKSPRYIETETVNETETETEKDNVKSQNRISKSLLKWRITPSRLIRKRVSALTKR